MTSMEIRSAEMPEIPAETNHVANGMNIANFNNESESMRNTYVGNEYVGRPMAVRKEPANVSIIGEQCKTDPGTHERVENEYLNNRECAEERGKFSSGEREIREIKDNEDGDNSTYESLNGRKQDDIIYLQLNTGNRIS